MSGVKLFHRPIHYAFSYFLMHSFVVLLFLLFFWLPTSNAEEQKTIRVGIFQNKPLSFVDEKGVAKGIYPDVIREIAQINQWDLEFVIGNWSSSLGRLEKGDIDLMISIVYSTERDKIFDFSKKPVVILWGQVYSLKDSGIVNILDLAGKNVAIMKKDINAKNFIQLCEKFNVKCNFIDAKIYDDVCQLIISKKVDAGVMNNINGEFLKRTHDIFATPIIFSPVVPVFAVPEKKNKYLTDAIDTQLTQWQNDKHSVYYSIRNKWFGDIKTASKLPFKLIAIIILIAAGISLFLLLWTGLLKRQVKKQTDELFESQKKLRAEKEFTETALNYQQDTFFLFEPMTGKAIRWNNAFQKITGYTNQEIINLPAPGAYYNEKDLKRASLFIEKVLATGPGTVEMELICKDGRKIPTEYSASVINDKNGNPKYIVSIGRDITERKKAEHSRKASQQRFLTVLNSIDASIYVTDIHTYEILFMNDNMVQTFGRDMTGETCWQSYRGESGPCLSCPMDKLLDKSGKPKGLYIWQAKNPISGKWYINYDRVIEWTDNRLVKIQIATDISELKRMEEELRQAHKMESIGTLAGGIAHDFNNILGIIIGNAELALDDIPENSPSFSHIKKVKTASLRAKEVVRQLLSFSRKTAQEQNPLDIRRVINESLKLIQSSFPSNIDIQATLPEDCGIVMADATQIHQVLINLCTNAAQAMEDGGVLKIKLSPLELKAHSKGIYPDMVPGNYLKIMISDTGSGIDPEVCNKIFDPYFTTKAVGKGTGMGLAVVHGIVKNHNGEIFVVSIVNKGTTFTILLPSTAETSKLKPEAELKENNPSGTETILFVDDEQALVELSKQALSHIGYTVEAFIDPNDAIKAFEADPDRYDLVISDMTMPGMSGIELSKKILQIQPNIPIIICTGHYTLIDEEKIKQINISAYATKPISMSELSQIIRNLLDEQTIK